MNIVKNLAIIILVIILLFAVMIFQHSLPDESETLAVRFLTSGREPLPTEDPKDTIINHLQKENHEFKMQLVSRGDIERKEQLKKDKIIKAINKNLTGNLGEFFYLAGKEYDVNPMMLSAIAKWETANLTSDLAKNHHNFGGINWSERWIGKYKRYGRYVSYPDMQTGIYEFARLIKEIYIDDGHDSLDKIQKKYAPLNDKDNGKYGMDNNAWLPNVEAIYIKILNDAK